MTTMSFSLLRLALVTTISLLAFAACIPTPLLMPRDNNLRPRNDSTSTSSICTIGFNDFSCSTGPDFTPALTMDASLPTWWPPAGLSWVGRVSECYNLLAPSCDLGTEPDCLGSNVPVASPFTTMWMIDNACMSDFGYIALFPVQNCSGVDAIAGSGLHVQLPLNTTTPGACENPTFEVYSFQMWEVGV